MIYFKALIDAAYSIMQIRMNLFGYNVTLWNVTIYCVVAFVLAYVFYRLFR